LKYFESSTCLTPLLLGKLPENDLHYQKSNYFGDSLLR
jgi:hypothetical protein